MPLPLLMSSVASGAGGSRPERPSKTGSSGAALLTMASAAFQPHMPIAERAMRYLDASPDPFHATQNACDRLESAGFTAIDEKDAWTGKLVKGGKYYFTRNRSCLVAFTVGGSYEPGNGFKVIGAHTDSPNLRVKPRSKRSSAGVTQLDVECYGGGLWHTWFDRDLSLSGRVMVRSEAGGFEQRLVRIDRPVLRVPTLCIHLQSPQEREAFKVIRGKWRGLSYAPRTTRSIPCAFPGACISHLAPHVAHAPTRAGEQGGSPAAHSGHRGTQNPRW